MMKSAPAAASKEFVTESSFISSSATDFKTENDKACSRKSLASSILRLLWTSMLWNIRFVIVPAAMQLNSSTKL